MKMNDITKGALLCLGILVLMAIAGTCDYQDAVHFKSTEEEGFYFEPDTTETAYDVIQYVQAQENNRPQ